MLYNKKILLNYHHYLNQTKDISPEGILVALITVQNFLAYAEGKNQKLNKIPFKIIKEYMNHITDEDEDISLTFALHNFWNYYEKKVLKRKTKI